MMIKTVTTVAFDPVGENKAMKKFTLENDMSKWKCSESTVAFVFIQEKTIFMDMRETE